MYVLYIKTLHHILRHLRVALVTQSCLTLCNSVDCVPPGSSIHRTLQARILEWVAISFSRGSSQPRYRTWVFSISGRFLTTWAQGKPTLGHDQRLNKIIFTTEGNLPLCVQVENLLQLCYQNTFWKKRKVKSLSNVVRTQNILNFEYISQFCLHLNKKTERYMLFNSFPFGEIINNIILKR